MSGWSRRSIGPKGRSSTWGVDREVSGPRAGPRYGGTLTLCDLSPGMVEAATRAVGGAGYDVEGLVADAQSIPLPDASRVMVVANHMLYHVPDPARAVGEFARILTDDGVVMAATNGSDHMAEILEIEHAVFPDRPVDRTAAAFGFDSGATCLEAAFAEVELRVRRSPLRVTDPEHVVAYATSYPPGEDADEDQLAHIRTLVDAAFSRGRRGDDGHPQLRCVSVSTLPSASSVVALGGRLRPRRSRDRRAPGPAAGSEATRGGRRRKDRTTRRGGGHPRRWRTPRCRGGRAPRVRSR